MGKFICMSIMTMKNTETYHGYFCEERVTTGDVIYSSEIPKDLKEHFNIYYFRHSDNGERDFDIIEPRPLINFSGSFVTSSDLSSEFDSLDGKYAKIYKYELCESFGERLKLLDEHTSPMDKLPPYPPGFVTKLLSDLTSAWELEAKGEDSTSFWESRYKGDNKK